MMRPPGGVLATIVALSTSVLVLPAQSESPTLRVAQEWNYRQRRVRLDEETTRLPARRPTQASEHSDGADVLGKPWHEIFEIWGFGAAGYLDSGNRGTRPNGGFLINEATLFIQADVWERYTFFIELQTNRLGKDDQLFTRTGEVYGQIKNLFQSEGPDVNVKVGRFDIPFGEEYLRQDAIDNALITMSAPYPYGWDEGVLLYGRLGSVNWIASVADGTDARSDEDNTDKAFNLKASMDLTDSLYVSASAMWNGRAGKSAVEFGGSHFQPVGASHASSAGTSPSTKVDAVLYEVDAKLRCEDVGHVFAAFGQAFNDDRISAFDRRITWFLIEPVIEVTDSMYVAGRLSEIGTYDSSEGYHFDGKTIAGGNAAFGYDTKRFQRLSLGVGWRLNPHARFKAEIGRDRFWVIDPSSANPGAGNRTFFGLQLVLSF